MNGIECRCDCHTHPMAVMHCVPCCEPCSFCGKRISAGAERHARSCSAETRKQLESMLGKPLTDAEFADQVRHRRSLV